MNTENIITSLITALLGGGGATILSLWVNKRQSDAEIKASTDKRWEDLNEWQSKEFDKRITSMENEIKNLRIYVKKLENILIKNKITLPEE